MREKETICVRGNYKPKVGEPLVFPIVQSTTYYYETLEQMADLFDLKAEGFFYSRLANPTVANFEEKLTLLEEGSGAIGCASGMSACLMAILAVCSAGDNVICSNAIYGGTYNLFYVTLERYGIHTKFFNPDAESSEIEKMIDDKTKIIYGETVANPNIIVLDFDKFSSIAKKYNLLFFVDNTLASPYFCQPKKFGANVIIHSSSKYLDGHAVALGGAIVDCGNFDFRGNNRYPDFNTPDESYHGLIYANLGEKAFLNKVRAQIIRDFGAIMSPQNAFLTNLGMETLHLRMKQHNENARKVAEFLANNNKVEWVKHPSLKTDKYYQRAQKYLPKGSTGMLSFGLKGGLESTKKFIANLKLISSVTHVADVRSCILNPASTTHRQLPEEALLAAGIMPNLIRLSVGIEASEDIIADIKNALEKI